MTEAAGDRGPVEEVVRFFGGSDAFREQDAHIKKLRAKSGAARLGCAIPLVVVAVILIPILLVWRQSLPAGGRGPVLIFAIGLGAAALVFLFRALKDLASSASSPFAYSLHEACETFYTKALCASTEGLSMAGRDDLIRDAAWVFPKPVLEARMRKLGEIATAWDEVRYDLGPKDKRLELAHLRIRKTPTAYERVTDLEVDVVIQDASGPVSFTNTAIQVEDRWYLLHIAPQRAADTEEAASS